MATQTSILAMMPPEGGDDLARRRFQAKGDLYEQGGFWKLRWREDQIAPDGSIKRGWSKPIAIGPSSGQGRLARKEAQKLSWDNFLSRLGQNTVGPRSMMKLRDFVEQIYKPGHAAVQKRPKWFAAMLAHVVSQLGDARLRDITPIDAQRAVSAVITGGYEVKRRVGKQEGLPVYEIDKRPYSVQTAKHIRNMISGIFTYAEEMEFWSGRNPAKGIRLPEMQRRPRHALSEEQIKALLDVLRSPAREMVLAATLTSMNVAEICGLLWKRVNLSDAWAICEGEAIPPLTIAVRQQFYRGQWSTLKRGARYRNIPIPAMLHEELIVLKGRGEFTGPDDPVFISTITKGGFDGPANRKAGAPVNDGSIAKWQLKPVGRKLGMPWLSWHCLRHTHATLTKVEGLGDFDRMRLMGHASMEMTERYTSHSTDQQRAALEQIGERLRRKPQGGVN